MSSTERVYKYNPLWLSTVIETGVDGNTWGEDIARTEAMENGRWTAFTVTDEDGVVHAVDLASMAGAVDKILWEYVKNIGGATRLAIDSEKDDADEWGVHVDAGIADEIVQVACFGAVVYG